MRIVSFERQTKAEHIAFGHQPVGFKSSPALRRRLVIIEVVGQENALGYYLRAFSEYAVNGLKAEVGHANPIVIRVDQMKTNIAAAFGRHLEQTALDR